MNRFLKTYTVHIKFDDICATITSAALTEQYTKFNITDENGLLPCAPNMVAFTVDRIFSCVPIVGILSQTCNRFCQQTNYVKIVSNSWHWTTHFAECNGCPTKHCNYCKTSNKSQIPNKRWVSNKCHVSNKCWTLKVTQSCLSTNDTLVKSWIPEHLLLTQIIPWFQLNN